LKDYLRKNSFLRRLADRIYPLSPRALGRQLRGFWCDRRLNIRTEAVAEPTAGVREACPDAVRYVATPYEVIEELSSYLGPEDVLVDIGCGKGRVLCVAAARATFRRAVGIELMRDLVEIARDNASRMRLRTPVQVVQGSAAEVSVDDGTVYFLFNPFGESTLGAVLENLRRSLEARPRQLRVFYRNPRFARLLEGADWLIPDAQANERFARYETLCWRTR
jgi:SAM-dependent methyltransferase